MAFKLAAMYAFSHAYKSADPVVLEPIMSVEVTVPVEFQGAYVVPIGTKPARRVADLDAMHTQGFCGTADVKGAYPSGALRV
jgi:hypothetical protein